MARVLIVLVDFIFIIAYDMLHIYYILSILYVYFIRLPFAKAVLGASFRKCISLRYLQDMIYFVNRGLLRKI